MHTPRKRFGQNFLHDAGIINSIISSLNIKKNDHFVEIGPGQGALTEPLLTKSIRLDVVELDRDLVELLVKKFDHYVNFNIYSADALTFDFSVLVEEYEKLRIVGNLPYNISTPLLFHLLKFADCIEDMHFMLQKEVVDRICANPGSKQYGKLSIMVQYYYAAEHVMDVGPESFKPVPKVTSAVVKLEPHRQPPVQIDDITRFKGVVTQAFSQRRKTVRNSLRNLISEADFESLSIDPNARAEFLSIGDFAKLSNLLGN